MAAGFTRVSVVVTLAAAGLWGDSRRQEFSDFRAPQPLSEGATLVIGVVGGWERWDQPKQIVRRVALRLRGQAPAGVYFETVENHRLELAFELALRSFDRNRDGRIDESEAARAHVIVYGQSLGGRAAVWLARRLETMQIRVRRLILVDAWGPDSRLIPANVREVANLYQRGLPVRGWDWVRMQDPARTKLLYSREYDYRGKAIDLTEAPPAKRFWQRGHTKMEFDPEVWAELERLISEVWR